MKIPDDYDKFRKRIRKIINFDRDCEYIKKAHGRGKKIALCCIILDKNHKTTDRMYYVSDKIEGARLLGEIELWKRDIIENLAIGEDDIDHYEDLLWGFRLMRDDIMSENKIANDFLNELVDNIIEE